MVELKRKRSQKDKSSRYPLSVQFSSLTYRQAPESLALSSHNVLALTSTRPHPHQFSTIAGDVFSLDMPIRKIPIKNVEQYHKQHTITHLKWNQKGNTLASIDETGHLALWQVNHTVHEWKLVYQTDLKQPLAAFLWLHSDRMYIMQDTIQRDGLYGPHNPYGQLGFMTVTTHGVITVHYQRNGNIFSSFSTPLPNIGRREISRADAGCFGMSLAGFDDWERISHADIMLHQDQIYLVTHDASLQHKTVWLHTIDIQFPKSKKGTIVCKSLSSLQLKHDTQITQLVLKQGSASLACVIGLGQVSHGCIATYELQTIQKTITSDLGTIQHERTSLVHQSSTEIQDRFITALKCTHQGRILVGLSDGSVHLENKEKAGYLEVDYRQVVGPQQDSIADIVLSPNQTHVVYLFSSMALGVASITQEIPDLSQQCLLCLLNNQDYTDLISELVRMPQPDTVIHDVLASYESYVKDSTRLFSEKAYGFALAVYRRLPNKQVQYTNFSRAIQLPLILECFMSATVDETTEFDVHSLWSLVSLSSWIYDYVRWLLREWYLLFHHSTRKYHLCLFRDY
ncbi:hypothetical protein CU098_007860 [Rhizopus stolonifer]|uniref:Mediator of RNA polymerase II transcription subunit 16 n=1 Tax=Rhizopus stolonifer TaxID=4846 RepID=A0A367JH61_RHIST|nr:hypothetical protein CU098_007860 [Rhizopus stolonifer]